MERIDKRIIKSRNLITSALLDLLAEKKFSRITIQDITDRANVGRATFYLHYKNKEECLTQLLTKGFEGFVNEVDQMINSPQFSMLDVIEQIFDLAFENRNLYLALIRDNPRLTLLSDIQEYIFNKIYIRIKKQSLVNEEITKAIGVQITGSLFSLLLWWLTDQPQLSSRQLAQIYTDSVGKGFEKYINKESVLA